MNHLFVIAEVSAADGYIFLNATHYLFYNNILVICSDKHPGERGQRFRSLWDFVTTFQSQFYLVVKCVHCEHTYSFGKV